MNYFANFVEFVNAQPRERLIDHSFGWSRCAVGDFVRETDIELGDYMSCKPTISSIANGFPDQVADYLGNPTEHNTVDTYGALATWLAHNNAQESL